MLNFIELGLNNFPPASAKIPITMRTKIFLLACLLVLIGTALAPTASAQIPGQPYRISDREVAKLLDQIKKESNSFRNSLKDALNKSRFDRTSRENDINAYVKDFEEQTKRLDDNFDSHKSTVADVDGVLSRAAISADAHVQECLVRPGPVNDGACSPSPSAAAHGLLQNMPHGSFRNAQ